MFRHEALELWSRQLLAEHDRPVGVPDLRNRHTKFNTAVGTTRIGGELPLDLHLPLCPFLPQGFSCPAGLHHTTGPKIPHNVTRPACAGSAFPMALVFPRLARPVLADAVSGHFTKLNQFAAGRNGFFDLATIFCA